VKANALPYGDKYEVLREHLDDETAALGIVRSTSPKLVADDVRCLLPLYRVLAGTAT
jgi:hypothetical protein